MSWNINAFRRTDHARTGLFVALTAGSIATLAGCAGESTPGPDDQAACEDAVAHIAACMPDQPTPSLNGCDAEVADRVLAAPCESLAATGKADGCNPFFWWTWAACGDNDTDDDDRPHTEEYDISVYVERCYDDFCLEVTGGTSCAMVSLVDESGTTVETTYTSTHGSARFNDVPLEDGNYRVVLHNADGSVATMMTSPAEGGLTLSERAPAEQPFKVVDGDAPERLRIYLPLEGSLDKIRRCAGIEGVVEATCDGDPLDPDEAEWTWFVRVHGETEAGEHIDTIRAFNNQGVNRFWFRELHAGSYKLQFIEMDIPDYRRRNNPDYEHLVDWYATNNVFAEELEISATDANKDVDVGTYALDSCD